MSQRYGMTHQQHRSDQAIEAERREIAMLRASSAALDAGVVLDIERTTPRRPIARMKKHKQAQAQNTNESSTRDRCQTPPYALTPLLPHLPPGAHIWEPAAGDGLLAQSLRDHGYTVRETDLLTGTNFFDARPESGEILVTNPPYSVKYQWLARCYEIGVPFALLMPVDVYGSIEALELYERYGWEVIALKGRIDYKMPDAGWSGQGAQFTSYWFTHRLGIGREMTTYDIRPHKPSKQTLAEWDAGIEQLTLFDGDTAPQKGLTMTITPQPAVTRQSWYAPLRNTPCDLWPAASEIAALKATIADYHKRLNAAAAELLKAKVECNDARAWAKLWKQSAKMDVKALRNLEAEVDKLREYLNSKGIYDISVLAGLHSLADRAYRAQEVAKAAGILKEGERPVLALMETQRQRDTAIRERNALQKTIDTLRAELSAREESHRESSEETKLTAQPAGAGEG